MSRDFEDVGKAAQVFKDVGKTAISRSNISPMDPERLEQILRSDIDALLSIKSIIESLDRRIKRIEILVGVESEK